MIYMCCIYIFLILEEEDVFLIQSIWHTFKIKLSTPIVKNSDPDSRLERFEGDIIGVQ